MHWPSLPELFFSVLYWSARTRLLICVISGNRSMLSRFTAWSLDSSLFWLRLLSCMSLFDVFKPWQYCCLCVWLSLPFSRPSVRSFCSWVKRNFTKRRSITPTVYSEITPTRTWRSVRRWHSLGFNKIFNAVVWCKRQTGNRRSLTIPVCLTPVVFMLP